MSTWTEHTARLIALGDGLFVRAEQIEAIYRTSYNGASCVEVRMTSGMTYTAEQSLTLREVLDRWTGADHDA